MLAPIVFETKHRIRFSDLDPYKHVSTAKYATYFVDHRMQGVRDRLGWSVEQLDALPFMVFVRRLEIDYVRPLRADQEVTITSFVREFRGPDALVECRMVDAAGKEASRCLMTVAFVDRETSRAKDWPADVTALFYERAAGEKEGG
jgi:acyl-CoA thioester hydrolase